MRSRVSAVAVTAAAWLCAFAPARATRGQAPAPVVLNDNGGWSWFEDERAILHDGKLLVSSVADASGTGGAARNGDVEVVSYDPASGNTSRFTLADNLQADDHNSAALLARPDGRYLAFYAGHNLDNRIRSRVSTHPGDATAWQPEQTLTRGAGVTYSNLFRLGAENNGRGRTYDFYRGEGFDPNVMVSDDNGATWAYAGRFLRNLNDPNNSARPYLKYASNQTDKVHFITTEGHPRNFNNSIYHGYTQGGKVYNSAGVRIGSISTTLTEVADPAQATRVFDSGNSPANRAWTHDVHLDAQGRPYAAFSVHKSNADHRYHYARWDGTQWRQREIAFAGNRLYAGEDDYTGGIALDPNNPDVVYISADVDPASGAALPGGRHEIFKGVTADDGGTFTWTPVTQKSDVDNLRPIVPVSDGKYHALLWLRGTYTSYTDYDLDVVAVVNRVP